MGDLSFRDNNKNFELLTKNALAGIIIVSNKGFILYANETFCKMLEYSMDDLINFHFLDFTHPDDKLSSKTNVDQLSGSDCDSFHLEKRYITKSQQIIWCEIFIACNRNKDGQVEYFTGIINNIDQRKKAEQTLRESEENYRFLVENMNELVCIVNDEGRYCYVSPKYKSILGYDPQEILGVLSSDLLHPDDLLKAQSKFTQILHPDVITKDEWRFRHKDGRWRWMECNASVCFDKAGKVKVIVIATDITERKMAEEALKESEERYRMLAENFPNGIVNIYDRDLKLLFVSGEEFKRRNIKAEDAIGKTFYELFPGETFEIAEPHLKKAFDGYISSYETPYINNTFYLVNVAPLKDRNGNVDRILLTSQNITESKLAEKALKENEQFLQKAQAMAHVGHFKINSKQEIIQVSDELLRIYGFQNSMRFEDFVNAVPLERRQRVANIILDAIKNKKTVFNVEHPIHSQDGSLKYVRVIGEIVPDANNDDELILLGTVQDITKSKRAEDELIKAKERAEESDRLKSAFLANMSHEIRTPMNAIKGFAELLGQPDLDEDKKKQFISIITHRTDDLLRLINDLLDIAKIEAGSLNLVEKPDSVKSLFEEINQTFISYSSNSRVTLQYKNELPEGLSTFLADFLRIRQIFINLISNAFKFTPSGFIEYGCRLYDPQTILFYVQDTGVGISNDKLDLIFEPFRQVDDEYLAKQNSGTGLGLSIVKGLIQLMQGSTWVESKEGEGSTFYFTIPFKPAQPFAGRIHTKKPASYNWKGKTILIVEDEIYNAQLMMELLLKTEVRVKHALNGALALEALKNDSSVDLVLMDIKLPDIVGYELVKMVKTINPSVPVIAQTAYATDGDRKKSLSAGFDDYISKPIDRNKLFALIQHYFTHS